MHDIETLTVDLLLLPSTSLSYVSQQKAKLEKLKSSRDQSAVNSALDALTQCAESGRGNLLELSIQASRARCTVGEISDALEKVVGRHVAVPRMVSGAYVSEYGQAEEVDKAMKRVEVCVCVWWAEECVWMGAVFLSLSLSLSAGI